MKEKDYLDLLEKREIQPTAIRILVLQAMLKAGRTITLFLSHHLIHSIDDGSGSFKYAVCSAGCSCEVNDLHTHFHCEECNKTFCFQNIPTPVVQVPEGFTLSSINYVLKGLCPECAAKVQKEN